LIWERGREGGKEGNFESELSGMREMRVENMKEDLDEEDRKR